MLSAVGESAQVALQAGTIAAPQQAAGRGGQKPGEKGEEPLAGTGKGKGDTVTISTEAKQLTRAAVRGSEESQQSPKKQSEQESARAR